MALRGAVQLVIGKVVEMIACLVFLVLVPVHVCHFVDLLFVLLEFC